MAARLDALLPRTRASSAERSNFGHDFSTKRHSSTLDLGQVGSSITPSRSRSPHFGQRLSKTAKSVSVSLRKLFGDMPSISSCGGGGGRGGGGKHAKRRHSPAMFSDLVPGLSRASTPSIELKAPNSPGHFVSVVTSSISPTSDQAIGSETDVSPSRTESEPESSPLVVPAYPQRHTISHVAPVPNRFQWSADRGKMLSNERRQSLLGIAAPQLMQLQKQQEQQTRRRSVMPALKQQDSPSSGRRSGTVTFSPAPFRKTRQGYEQSTL